MGLFDQLGHWQCSHDRRILKSVVSKLNVFLGDLLDHVGGHVDPLRVITRIPKGMEIWDLRNRLCRIISDYRTQTSLQEGCSHILKADCVHLNAKLYSEVRHGVRNVYMGEGGSENTSWVHYNAVTGNSVPASEPTLGSIKFPKEIREADEPSEENEQDRMPLKIGLLMEDESHNVDYTESMRFKIPRAKSSIDERELLPSLIQ